MRVDAIFGPPGTGKTRTLLKKASGKKALILSFTKAGAIEARSRIEDNAEITASTIHSLAFNKLGVNRAQVVDGKKLIEFGKEAGIPFKGSEEGNDELQEGDEYASVLSFANNRIIPVMEAYKHFGCPGTMHRFEMYVKSYHNWKRTFGYMDFDDMLQAYLERAPELDFDHVYLDEAQDCSPLQWSVLNHILRPDCEVIIAGDDDQAIYEWNGADPHGMVDFLQANHGEMQVLGRSFRVPRIVHDLAHEVCLQHISRRVDKKFLPRDAEGSVTSYGDFYNIDPHSLAADGGSMVLVRDRWRLEEVKRTFNRDMVPYSVMGGASPWTSRIANELRDGKTPEIPLHWRDFYSQADLTKPINISLSTIHQAKGREHPHVVLDLNLPMRTLAAMYNDRDAELRVLYVALTRTSDRLTLCGGNPLL